jgi:hypothetical protein
MGIEIFKNYTQMHWKMLKKKKNTARPILHDCDA